MKIGPSRRNSPSTQNMAKMEEGSNHLVECTGPGVDGSGCVIWSNIWVPTLIPQNFFSRLFLCGFCAFEELKKIHCSADGNLSLFIEADSLEQYWRRENVRIFDVEKEPGEDVLAKNVSVAEKAGVSITKNDVSIAIVYQVVLLALNHLLPSLLVEKLNGTYGKQDAR